METLMILTEWFFIGTIIFVIGLGLYIAALYNFATTSQDKPVTNGVYSLTRHPMQITSIIMWIGIGIASTNLIIITTSIILALISNFSFIAQEQCCIETCGELLPVLYEEDTTIFIFRVG